MDDEAVRAHARTFAEALVAGDVDGAIARFSPELRRNLGEVLALFPLPATEAAIQSVEHSGAGYNVVVRLVGETEETEVQTRWKDRDGEPTIVEASHLSSVARPETTGPDEVEGSEPTE